MEAQTLSAGTTTSTKPTMRFIVSYTCTADPTGFGIATWRCYAFDAEHAKQKFLECSPDDGWLVVRVERPRTAHGKVYTSFDRVSA